MTMMRITRFDVFALLPLALLVVFGWLAWENKTDLKNLQAMQTEQAEKAAAPAQNWFEVSSVFIPSHEVGTDPVVIYNRTIKKPFQGRYVAEAHNVAAPNIVVNCSGTGTYFYKPTDKLPETITLSWLVGRGQNDPCVLPVGDYYIEFNWYIWPEGYQTKFLEFRSVVFSVIPKGAQLYITPEQVKKLDEVIQ